MGADKSLSIYRILVIEDDPSFQSAITASLPKEVFAVGASTAAEARKRLEEQVFDLILLDLSLPDEDGMRLCSWIRSEERFLDIPIFLLTGRAETEDKVMAFSLGVDDYLVKPTDPREFKARLLSKLKKSRHKTELGQIVCKGNIKFLISSQQVFIHSQGRSEKIETSPLEFRLLLLLAQNETHIFSRDELITKIWGENVHILDRTVDSHISDLRKKLAFATYRIQSVRGVGYQFIPVSTETDKKAS